MEIRVRLTFRVLATALFLTIGISQTARSALIEADLVAGSGDKLLTQDTATGLEWLDLTHTTSLSINTVLGGSLINTDGFRYAIESELITLWTGQGINTDRATSTSNFAGASSLLALMGCTLSCSSSTGTHQGYILPFSDPPGTFYAPFLNVFTSSASVGTPTGFSGTADDTFSFVGHFLIRNVAAVPEPATLALFGLGLAGLGVMRRRRLR